MKKKYIVKWVTPVICIEKKSKKKYRYFGNMIAKSAGRNKNWSRLRANCHEFEGNEPFQIKSPESALKIPLICHIGFAKWPTW